MDLDRVKVIFPLGGHIVRITDDFTHEDLRVEDIVCVGDHTPGYSEDRGEDTDIEEDRAMRSYLEVQEEVWVDQ